MAPSAPHRQTRLVIWSSALASLAAACAAANALHTYGLWHNGIYQPKNVFSAVYGFLLFCVYEPILPMLLLALLTAVCTLRRPEWLILPAALWAVSFVSDFLLLPNVLVSGFGIYASLWDRYPVLVLLHLAVIAIMVVSLVMLATYLGSTDRAIKPLAAMILLNGAVSLGVEVYNQATGFHCIPWGNMTYLFASVSLLLSVIAIARQRSLEGKPASARLPIAVRPDVLSRST